MAGATKPIFVAKVNNKGATWTNGDVANTRKDVFVAGADGSKCRAISATSTETANARDFAIYLYDGSTAYLAHTTTIAVKVGFEGATSSVNLLAGCPWANPDGSVDLPTGWKIQVENLTQVASGKTVTLVALGGDFTA